MASNFVHLTFILSIILVSATTIVSFDITKLLQDHGEYSTFNDLLTQTGLATNINNRQTITVFVVDNSGMGAITSKPREVIKNILATHVVLDYYDTKKLADFSSKSATLTTLFQATGAAMGQQGSLKVSSGSDGVVLGSAVDKAPQNSKVVKSVVSEPYNISVIQISQPIMTPGIDQIAPAGAPRTSTPTVALSPKKSHEGKAPASESSDSETTDTSSAPSPNGGASDEDGADEKQSSHKAAGTRVTNVGGLSVVVLALMGLIALTL